LFRVFCWNEVGGDVWSYNVLDPSADKLATFAPKSSHSIVGSEEHGTIDKAHFGFGYESSPKIPSPSVVIVESNELQGDELKLRSVG